MKKILLISTFILLGIHLFAWDSRVIGEMTLYPDSEIPALCDAPAGYQPFYISHYGRHGSRALTSSYKTEIGLVWRALSEAHSDNALSPEGERLFAEVEKVYRENVGNMDFLSGKVGGLAFSYSCSPATQGYINAKMPEKLKSDVKNPELYKDIPMGYDPDEVAMRGATPVSGLFYRWEDVRGRMKSRIHNTCDITENTDKRPIIDVRDFGAVPDGLTDCTAAFNNAISSCSEVHGIVRVPAGQYLCSTIEMKSDVELRLEKDAEILANLDPETYKSFIPKRDMSCYDSGNGTLNQNNSKDLRWNRALILANDVENIAITGEGSINGRHVFDALGEEKMRGPHAMVFGDCRNVCMSGITINCAANYAFMGYALENAVFSDVKINEGWDGIHIRGGKNVSITGCHFQTGDDSIAGGYWQNMTITGCDINSSCNGIRMIMPSENLLITECNFHGPGVYPHRTSGEAHRTNMLFGVIFEPGGWGAAPGDLKNLVVSNCTMSNVQSPVAVNISKDNTAYDLTVTDITATGVYDAFNPIVTFRSDKGFEKMTVSNITMTR